MATQPHTLGVKVLSITISQGDLVYVGIVLLGVLLFLLLVHFLPYEEGYEDSGADPYKDTTTSED